MLIKLLGLLLLFYPVHSTYAMDETFLKALCMPEKGVSVFSLDREAFSWTEDYLSYGRGDTTSEKSRRETLAGHGIITERNFEYVCRLKHVYKLSGKYQQSKDKGMCGGNPRITASLSKDGEDILTNVYFSPNCEQLNDKEETSAAYVKSFTIDDLGLSLVTISNGDTDRQFKLDESFPWNQETLSCLMSAEKRYFSVKKSPCTNYANK